MRDAMDKMHPVNAIPPAAATTDETAWVGSIIDGAGYDSLTYVIVTGTETDADATFAVTLEEGNDSGLSDTAAATLFTGGGLSSASFTFASDHVTRKLGYLGVMRYTRLTITPTNNNSGNAFVAAVAILENPHNAPTSNP